MRRSTTFLVAIFLFLAALTWLTQQPENPISRLFTTPASNSSGSEVTFLTSAKGPLRSISIQDSAEKTLSLDYTNGQWFVKTDKSSLADQGSAETAASQALYLRIIKKFDTPPDTAGTGLNNPSFTINLILEDGSAISLRIGNTTVTKSGYYALSDDGHVLIIGKDEVDVLLDLFSKPPLPVTSTPAAGNSDGTSAPTPINEATGIKVTSTP